jgi:hypothetical protein
MDIRFPAKNTWDKNLSEMNDKFKSVLDEVMEENRAAEKAIAISNGRARGRVDKNGICEIDIVVDGGYSEHSHGMESYS